MQPMLIMPVANGILPRPQGGTVVGMFLIEAGGQLLIDAGIGKDILVCPWTIDNDSLYSVGVTARIMDISEQLAVDQTGQEIKVLIATLEGLEHARWYTLQTSGTSLYSSDIELLDLKSMRKEYPTVSGAGWMPEGGYTEFRGDDDLPVTLYGSDLETGRKVSLTANLGGLVKSEQAHTVEHAIIRALRTCGLCTPRTLAEAMVRETDELKQSVEASIRYEMPEILGRTASGICGNPMTNLAQYYLAHEFAGNLQAGKTLNESLVKARRSTMSQLTQGLNLTMNPNLRKLQGLKKGMSHDDTPLRWEICKKVLGRFPSSPWE